MLSEVEVEAEHNKARYNRWPATDRDTATATATATAADTATDTDIDLIISVLTERESLLLAWPIISIQRNEFTFLLHTEWRKESHRECGAQFAAAIMAIMLVLHK